MERLKCSCSYQKELKRMGNFMMYGSPIVWLIVVIAMIVLEVSTYQLVTVWFALGAAVSLIASLFKVSGTAQLMIFVIVSLVSLIASRPLVKKIQSAPKEKTNADRVIGQIAKVIQPVSADNRGRIRVDGLDWSAAVQNKEDSFEIGEEAQVVRIEGVTAYIQRKNS